MPALERLGLVSRLDKWVVSSVIDQLRAHPTISLGCNISIQSATLDGWWSSVIKGLRREPQLAARLVIEITQTAPLTDMRLVLDFVRALQLLGCRIALDDVGAGYSCVKGLTELGADIVKVDGSYLHAARSSDSARMRFRSLIGLARACASHVVLEGIESEEDLRLSLACGAHWVQGYLFDSMFRIDSICASREAAD